MSDEDESLFMKTQFPRMIDELDEVEEQLESEDPDLDTLRKYARGAAILGLKSDVKHTDEILGRLKNGDYDSVRDYLDNFEYADSEDDQDAEYVINSMISFLYETTGEESDEIDWGQAREEGVIE